MTLSYASAPLSQDQEHLRLLGIGYCIYGGLQCLGLCIGVIYLVILLAASNALDRAEGIFFAVVDLIAAAVSAVLAGLYLLVARWPADRRRYVLIMVLAGLACLSVPLGTVLGVFTFIVLTRQSVSTMFGMA